MSLHYDRRIIVDAIFQDVEFPDMVNVLETSGWEHTEGGTENNPVAWNRPLYLEDTENPDGDTVSATFTVIFYPNSVQVKEVLLNNTTLKVPAPY